MALPKKLLSVDIGNERIKIAYLARKGRKTHLLKAIIVPTPSNCVKDGILSDLEDLAGAIKEALSLEKVKEKNVVFSISSSKIITREVELPYLKPSKLKNVIRLNAEEYFPVNLTEYSLDYTVTDVIESENGKKAKVIVFAASNALVEQYIQLSNLCGLNVQSVDYSGNSIVSYIRNEKIEGTNLYLDIGAESTMVTIMSDNVVKFSRNILIGTRLINESIMNHFEVDYEEATQIAKERQLLNYDHMENTYLSNDVTGGMEQILNGVSRLVDYYTSRNKTSVEKIYILGGGSEIYGITEYIKNFFNLETEKLIHLKSVLVKDKNSEENIQLYFSTAIGAILTNINLLPIKVKNREIEKTRRRVPYLLLILLVVALGAFYYTKFTELSRLNNQKEQIQSKIDSMQDIKDVQLKHDVLTKKKEEFKLLDTLSTSQPDRVLDIIKNFESTMPKELYITSLNIQDSSMTLNAIAKDETVVAQFLTYLKMSTETDENGEHLMFSDVFTNVIARDNVNESEEDSRVPVSIQCTFYSEEVTKSE